jgi:hypothetical protein
MEPSFPIGLARPLSEVMHRIFQQAHQENFEAKGYGA